MKSRHIFVFIPLVLFSLSGISAAQAQGLTPEQFRETLDPYVGVWQGEYRIYSQEDELLNQFKLNRNYWWDGLVLMGRISYDFGEVKQTFFHRIILSEGVPFSFVTESAGSTEVRSALKGELLKGTLVWTRVMPRESLPVRISERIVESGDGRFIEFWGNQEAIDANGSSFLVRIEGFAAYLPDSRDFVVATEGADGSELEVSKLLDGEDAASPEADPVADRARRLRALDPDRRVAAVADDTATAKSPETPSNPPSPNRVEAPVAAGEVEQVAPEDQKVDSREPTPQLPTPVPEPTEDPEITEALQSLNIVGINDRPGEVCIVVDYFLLFEVGDSLDLEKPCVFVGVDSQYLYFEDENGYRYRLFRKDAVPQ